TLPAWSRWRRRLDAASCAPPQLPRPYFGAVDTKSLSHKCAPHDDGRGEVNEGEVVLRLLLPPDEQLATAVEPRGRSFDDPPAGACPVPAGAAAPPPPAGVLGGAAGPRRAARRPPSP